MPFTADEFSRAGARLKKRKAPGPDGQMAEHLKGGGEAVVVWLLKILNVYEGGGKDSMKTDSYRVITLTSMVTKVLEFLLLECLESIFLEVVLPHINQSAYRKGVSCGDAVFAMQEVIAKYLRDGNCVYIICACMICKRLLTL